MKRVLALLPAAAALLLLAAPSALAMDGGEGWYGEADDKVVTNAGFILIIFFPLLIFVLSMLEHRSERRKERREKAAKALQGERAWRGGW